MQAWMILVVALVGVVSSVGLPFLAFCVEVSLDLYRARREL